MMNIFIPGPGEAPSERWLKAFAASDRMLMSWSEALSARTASGDMRLVWCRAAGDEWLVQLQRLRQTRPQDGLIVMSDDPVATECAHIVTLGARGYCHSLATTELIREVSTVVAHGGLWIGPELMTTLVKAAGRLLPARIPEDVARLFTPRERDVVVALIGGLSNKECARKLDITERTVKAHLSSVFEKCGVRDRVQLLVRLAELSSPPEAKP